MDGKNLGGLIPRVAKIWVAYFQGWQKSGWLTSKGGKNPGGKLPWMAKIWVANFHGWQKSMDGIFQDVKHLGGKLPWVAKIQMAKLLGWLTSAVKVPGWQNSGGESSSSHFIPSN